MPEWTPEQQKAIDTRDRNLLVSAAAGSGKTAVLVQRVIEEITDSDPNKRRDIDSLVIVTFTRASAAEMRDRLRRRLQDMLQKDPGNEVIRRQLRLLPDAPICTIDSFCLKIVREHYTEINLDPGFHTADESESALLRADVLDEMFEEQYAQDAASLTGENSPANAGQPGADSDSSGVSFSRIAALYGNGKDDRKLADTIIRIWTTAQSFAWPDEWFEHCTDVYDMDEKQFLQLRPVKDLIFSVKEKAQELLEKESRIRELLTHGGVGKYEKNVNEHVKRLNSLSAAEDPETIREILSEKLSRKASVRTGTKGTDQDAAKEISAWIDDAKAAELAFGGLHLESAAGDLKKMRPYANKLVELTLEFDRRYKEAKSDRGILEFSDIEHDALRILARRENGKTVYTKSADELAAHYSEILIDEYQDSNRLQEEILNAVSHTRLENEKNNITMVGDLKQSIYRFRQADPELFAEKSRTYLEDGEDFAKVMLNRNFRSRRGVIDSVNAVFSDVMSEKAGGTDYGEEEKLTFGFKAYEDVPAPAGSPVFTGDEGRTEVVLIEAEKKPAGRQAQAVFIAKRIKEMLAGGYQTYDTQLKRYRPLQRKDIAILVRSAAKSVPILVRTLEDEDVDCYAESRAGFFQTWEIQQIVNLLKLIDNPLQDIPAAAVMLSFFGGFSADELTRIRLAGRQIQQENGKKKKTDIFLWLVLTQISAGENSKITEKGALDADLIRRCRQFTDRINAWRESSRVLSVHDLMWKLVCDTGFYRYAQKQKSGRRRAANLDSLLDYAQDFDQTGYHGLFQFLRYIAQIESTGIEIGERSAVSEEDDVVRIMTIHKSKGLEFPVVFVAEMGQEYKQEKDNFKIAVSRETGLILRTIDEKRRASSDSLLWNLAKTSRENEDKSEEMRLLYVAMTRAREKLILVGSVTPGSYAQSAAEGTAGGDEAGRKTADKTRSVQEVLDGKCYFDLVMPTVFAYRYKGGSPFVMDEETEEIGHEEMTPERKVKKRLQTKEIQEIPAPWRGKEYPYPLRQKQKPKVSVSEIKRQMFEDEQQVQAESEAQFLKEARRKENREETDRTVPHFLQTEKRYSAPARGTAYHRIMQLLDFTDADSPEKVKAQMEKMLASGRISQETADCVQYSRIAAFFATSLGEKARSAAAAGKLHREQPFLFEREYAADRGDKQKPGKSEKAGSEVMTDAEDQQLVQGVIDLYFEYEGELYLVDYKTDRVKGEAGEKELRDRYQIQVDLYAKALEKAMGKKVSHRYIYSFALKKELLS